MKKEKKKKKKKYIYIFTLVPVLNLKICNKRSPAKTALINVSAIHVLDCYVTECFS